MDNLFELANKEQNDNQSKLLDDISKKYMGSFMEYFKDVDMTDPNEIRKTIAIILCDEIGCSYIKDIMMTVPMFKDVADTNPEFIDFFLKNPTNDPNITASLIIIKDGILESMTHTIHEIAKETKDKRFTYDTLSKLCKQYDQ